jgi:hypothetical protein
VNREIIAIVEDEIQFALRRKGLVAEPLERFVETDVYLSRIFE